MSNQMSKEQLANSKISYTFISPIFSSAAGMEYIYDRKSLWDLDKRELEISERKPSPDMIAICYSH